MGFLDKAKAAAEQAAAKAKEGVEDVQTKRELGQAYNELGKTAFDLIESGALSHPSLDPLAEKVRTLNEKAGGGDETLVGATSGTGSSTGAEHDPGPPAMPT